MQSVELKYTSAYHPQSDAQTEVVNRSLECYLRYMSGHLPKNWCTWLSLPEFWYNTFYHSTIKLAPFQALYGVAPPIHLPYFPRDSPIAVVDVFMQEKE